MRIVRADTNRLKKEYIAFNRSLYADNDNFKGDSIFMLKDFLYEKSAFTRRVKPYPIMVDDDGIKATAVLVIADDTCFVSFLEFAPYQRYLSVMIDEAENLARKNGARKIIIGINGHVSYGAGILTEGFEHPQIFGCNYNHSYYPEIIEKMRFRRKELTSYQSDFSKIVLRDEIVKDVQNKFTFRKLDKSRYKRDILIFGDLCNKCLIGTANYYEKTAHEMYELVRDMKFLLKPDDLTFALKDGKEIGFLFIHPDYNELVKGGIFNPVSVFLRYLGCRGRTNKVIFNTMGILPEYRREKVMIGLFANTNKYMMANFKIGVTTFIQAENTASDTLSKTLSTGVYSKYCIYEKDLFNA